MISDDCIRFHMISCDFSALTTRQVSQERRDAGGGRGNMISNDFLWFLVISYDPMWFHVVSYDSIMISHDSYDLIFVYVILYDSIRGQGTTEGRPDKIAHIACTWFPMISNDFVWFPMISYYFLWLHMFSYDFIWFHMISYDFVWFRMMSYDFLWFRMISFKFFWFLQEQAYAGKQGGCLSLCKSFSHGSTKGSRL